ncbi:MAG: permease [Leptolyngbyaceae cyanobacterium CRU_2_3]|nr:permease [Leptolyngbyaceae cyanobacterium CRU_2_3]
MNQFNNALTLFFSLLVEALPFLILGVLFSSALLLFVDERRLVAAMPRNPFLAALAGSLIGCFFPVCECGNVPVARRLIVQGAPSAMAIGFLLAAPTVNPIVFWATWTAFRDQPEIVFLRIGLTLLITTTIGWVFSAQKDIRPLLQTVVARAVPGRSASGKRGDRLATPTDENALLHSGTFILGQSGQPLRLDTMSLEMSQAAAIAATDRPFLQRLRLMLDNVVQELRELGGVLIIGTAIAATVQTAFPREVILSLGQSPVTSVVAMMVLACVVSICSTVDAFFALSFASSFTSGALLAFLVFGPMFDLKNIALLASVFRPRPIIYLFSLAALLTFFFTLLINLYFS